MTAKKIVERQRLMSFLKCLGLEHLDPQDAEAPDLLLQSGDRTVGVEVTHLVSNRAPDSDNPKQSSRVFDQLVSRILAQYEEAAGPPVSASLKFADGLRVARADMERIARDLALALARQVRQHELPFEFSPNLHGLLRAAVWPCAAGRAPFWHRDVSGMVHTVQPQDILFTLAGKERKIAGYRLRADEIWLLIICDFMANGLFIDPPEEPVQFRINSDFDRLFCLAWTGNYAVEFPR